MDFLAFKLGPQRVALPLEVVERVERAVEATALPGAPGVIAGIVDWHGTIIPVADARTRLGVAVRDIEPTDQLVISRAVPRVIAMLADTVEGVIGLDDADIVEAGALVPGLEHVAGIARSADGLLLIQNLARFLSLDEARALDAALAATQP